tara:strand:- start:52 stop:393 length:342 start_codon:yes stop_codon:yes gene_type:complete
MTNIVTGWTEESFKAYLLVYASQSNQIETEDEKDFIESNFDNNLLKKVYKEIKNDNDYDRIQKILSFVKEKEYSNDDLKKILDELKNMYLCDGSFDMAEQMIFNSLKKLLKVS